MRTITMSLVAALVVASMTSRPLVAAEEFNCPYAGGFGGINCADNENCCGYRTMSPKCMPKDSTDKCCTHYIAATTCDASKTCCGAYGVGASSYAFCCDEGSTCCHALASNQGATCCPTGSTCCAGYSVGVCCAPDEECNPNQNSCVKRGTPAQQTNAPAVPEPPATVPAGPTGISGPVPSPSVPEGPTGINGPQPPATTANFCAYAGSNNGGITCSENENCCGYGTMTPKCIPKDSTDKCCTHFLSATSCAASKTCCGAYGPGASSGAFCCDEGSTCCHAQSLTQGATCCSSGKTCCAGSTVGLCCADDEECAPTQNSCVKKGTPAQQTNAPGVPEPTPASGLCAYAASNNGITCSENENCCGYGSMTPKCIPKDSTDKCCTHFLSATSCDSSKTCCGAYGPGASSYAFCCDEGSTCCHAQTWTQGATCCSGGTTCCAGTTQALCCADDEVCAPTQNSCVKRGGPTGINGPLAQNTNAPGVPEPPATMPANGPTGISGPVTTPSTASPSGPQGPNGINGPTGSPSGPEIASPLTTNAGGNANGGGLQGSQLDPTDSAASSRAVLAVASGCVGALVMIVA